MQRTELVGSYESHLIDLSELKMSLSLLLVRTFSLRARRTRLNRTFQESGNSLDANTQEARVQQGFSDILSSLVLLSHFVVPPVRSKGHVR
jgi:hypothetical protein